MEFISLVFYSNLLYNYSNSVFITAYNSPVVVTNSYAQQCNENCDLFLIIYPPYSISTVTLQNHKILGNIDSERYLVSNGTHYYNSSYEQTKEINLITVNNGGMYKNCNMNGDFYLLLSCALYRIENNVFELVTSDCFENFMFCYNNSIFFTKNNSVVIYNGISFSETIIEGLNSVRSFSFSNNVYYIYQDSIMNSSFIKISSLPTTNKIEQVVVADNLIVFLSEGVIFYYNGNISYLGMEFGEFYLSSFNSSIINIISVNETSVELKTVTYVYNNTSPEIPIPWINNPIVYIPTTPSNNDPISSSPLDIPSEEPVEYSPDGNIIITPSSGDNSTNYILSIVLPCVFGVMLIVGIVVGIIFIKKKRRQRRRKFAFNKKGLKIIKKIGFGSSGDVYIGEYNKISVAIKMTKDDSINDEIEILKRIPAHPNVVSIIGYIKEDRDKVLMLEYCNGGSLDKMVKSIITLNTKEKWIKEVISGLMFLHEKGIIHRDIAARNILVHNNIAKISDFGFARQIEDDYGKTKTNIGPIKWMAPESIKNKIYSTNSDIWMLGICIYEIMSGKEPYENTKDIYEIAISIRDKGLLPDLTGISEKYSNIIKKCCVYEPERRITLNELYNLI